MQQSVQLGRGLVSGAPCRARTLRCTTSAALLPPRPAVAFVRPGNAALHLPRQAPTISPVVCNVATLAAAATFSDDGSPAASGAFVSFNYLSASLFQLVLFFKIIKLSSI